MNNNSSHLLSTYVTANTLNILRELPPGVVIVSLWHITILQMRKFEISPPKNIRAWTKVKLCLITRPMLLKSAFQGRTISRFTSDKMYVYCIGFIAGLCRCPNNNEVVRFVLPLPVLIPETYFRWSPQIIWWYCSNFNIFCPHQTHIFTLKGRRASQRKPYNQPLNGYTFSKGH